MRWRQWAVAVVAMAMWPSDGSADRLADIAGPVEDGAYVVDQAGLVPPESAARMTELLAALLRDTDIQFVAVSVPALDDESVDVLTNALFERLKVGHRTRANRGLLLVIAEREQQVRLEVSYGLEAIFTDAFVSYVEREQMVPYFERRMIGEGIEATVELIAGRAFQQILGKGYDPGERGPEAIGGYRSGGAGAQTPVPLRDGSSSAAPAAASPEAQDHFSAQPTPELAWQRFLELNQRHVKGAELGIYDEAAKALLRQRPYSNAAQDHIARLYADTSYVIRQEGDRAAVVFLRDPDHLLAPWCFHRTGDGWQLDGDVPNLIAYNHLNQWHFKRLDHPYMFAFADFTFDAHGFGFPKNR